MKIRNGFVSNSSSSSFIIDLDKITKEQLFQIQNHVDYIRRSNDPYASETDEWNISIDEKNVEGYTSMDNFDMGYYLENIVGIDGSLIKWSRY